MSGALARAVKRAAVPAAPDVERCDLCRAPVPERHRHLLDQRTGELLCGCQACSLLFDREAAGRGHYRLVPPGRTRLADVSELGIPVGLAFFVEQPGGTVTAHYPNPLGDTRWDVDPRRWSAAAAARPELAAMEPGLQALLVNTARGADEHWIVPIDDCYRLAALVRREWTGLSGGSRVWPAIDAFFAELRSGR